MVSEKLIVACDFSSIEELELFLKKVKYCVKFLKIGPILFIKYGPDLIKRLKDDGYNIFLDLKLHDIPNTVGGAIKSMSYLGVDIATIHLGGGRKMLEYAKDARTSSTEPALAGVSVLTSIDKDDARELGWSEDPEKRVIRLTELAKEVGLEYVVCSALEVGILKKRFGDIPGYIVPGIRPKGFSRSDQKRVATPYDAIKNGADYIVVGRAITQSESPLEVLKNIDNEIQSALSET